MSRFYQDAIMPGTTYQLLAARNLEMAETARYNEEVNTHIRGVWSYVFGGATDVVSLEEFTTAFSDNLEDHDPVDCMFCQCHG